MSSKNEIKKQQSQPIAQRNGRRTGKPRETAAGNLGKSTRSAACHRASARTSQVKRPLLSWQRILLGALSGCAATAPMTAVMELGFRRLPAHERYPLPPREITEKVSRDVELDESTTPEDRDRLALAAHFGYGTAVGSIFGLMRRRPGRELDAALMGSGYGLLVWAGSYLGLLPALNILEPATKHPRRRNLLMIGAHLVWGATLGLLYDAFASLARKRRA